MNIDMKCNYEIRIEPYTSLGFDADYEGEILVDDLDFETAEEFLLDEYALKLDLDPFHIKVTIIYDEELVEEYEEQLRKVE